MPRATELDHSASAARAISAPVTALAPPPTVAGAPWRFRAALWWLNRLAQRPFDARWRWARRLAWLHLGGDPVFQEVLRTNLRLCLPHLTDAERTQLAQANAEETFFAWLDRFRCWRLDPAQLRAQVMLGGIEHLSRAHGRPVVLVCPHLLGMEAGVQRLSLEVQTIALYRPAAHPAFDALRCAARSRFNSQILVDAGASMLPVMRKVASGTPLFLLPDLDPGRTAHEFAPFFGVSAATARTVAWCAARFDATVVPFTVLRVGADRFHATLHAPLAAAWHDAPAALAQLNAFIEAQVRRAPAQYWWAHARFATRPPGAAAVYSAAVLKQAA